NDVENFAVGDIRQRGWLSPVTHGQLHRLHHVPFAVALWSVAHRAVIPKHLASLSKTLGAGFDRIYARRILRRNFVVARRFGFVGVFLRTLPSPGNAKTRKHNRTKQKKRSPHTASLHMHMPKERFGS